MNRIAMPYLALFILVSLVSTESSAASTNCDLNSLRYVAKTARVEFVDRSVD